MATAPDTLDVYSTTHTIRLLIVSRIDTVLTYEQLRNPETTRCLVTPLQLQIRRDLTPATIYALILNVLHFQKEAQTQPALSGLQSTCADVCELLALKLLRYYEPQHLVNALSFDFYPLQGLQTGNQTTAKARSSALELAVRASAKKFLSHDLVVRHLEAIWKGRLVIYCTADTLHRSKTTDPERQRLLSKDSILDEHSVDFTDRGRDAPTKKTIYRYDPQNASPLKLSRLRVPRYRQFFTTCSLASLLCLYLTVLVERRRQLGLLEFLFWAWSTGFMLDDIVEITEQGMSLYFSSLWNLLDFGILASHTVYMGMRIYGVFLHGEQKTAWVHATYDVLAASAILLFPRLFSVLDHSRYFSRLLIAFRLMVFDLLAVFLLILVACSGFFVAFANSMNAKSPGEVAYQIFQILMGFTPTVWQQWTEVNFIGKVLLTIFLFICHYLVVTILISVLTNSFTAIVKNAHEEHQYLFAVNVLSMVKTDALFGYVAPTNILFWLVTPMKYLLDFPTYIWLNRTIIKITHFPLLMSIFLYERLLLNPRATSSSSNHMISSRGFSFAGRLGGRDQASQAEQAEAVDHLFRCAPQGETLRSIQETIGRRPKRLPKSWMQKSSDALTQSDLESRKSSGQTFVQPDSTAKDERDLPQSTSLIPSMQRLPEQAGSDPVWTDVRTDSSMIDSAGANATLEAVHEHDSPSDLPGPASPDDATKTRPSRPRAESVYGTMRPQHALRLARSASALSQQARIHRLSKSPGLWERYEADEHVQDPPKSTVVEHLLLARMGHLERSLGEILQEIRSEHGRGE